MGQDSKSNRGELGEIRTQLAALASGGQILELNRHRMQCKGPPKPAALPMLLNRHRMCSSMATQACSLAQGCCSRKACATAQCLL